jgi:ABC-2 type transport system ATP-binding protein
MRQRIRLAQSIAHDPEVLVLDEPLNGLDPLVRAETIALFKEFAAQGRHVILSSHVLQEVDVISDQVILISNGSIIAEGRISGVREEMTQEHPSQILLKTPDAHRLAASLFAGGFVEEIRLRQEGDGMLIMTRSREKFSQALNDLIRQGVRLESIMQADENVDSLYEYLIGGGR